MTNYDQWKTRSDRDDMPDLTGDDEADFERDADYFQYQLQCAFEDLCGLIGYDRALKATIVILREHQQMLKRQGRR